MSYGHTYYLTTTYEASVGVCLCVTFWEGCDVGAKPFSAPKLARSRKMTFSLNNGVGVLWSYWSAHFQHTATIFGL